MMYVSTGVCCQIVSWTVAIILLTLLNFLQETTGRAACHQFIMYSHGYMLRGNQKLAPSLAFMCGLEDP